MLERKGYVYKFIDENNRILYIGKTTNMERRMKQHFSSNSHLKKQGKGDIYNKIQRIEYLKCNTEYDALVKELYYINYYKPKYNTASKIKQLLPPLEKEDRWKVYKVIKPLKKENTIENKIAFKLLPIAMVLFFIFIVWSFI